MSLVEDRDSEMQTVLQQLYENERLIFARMQDGPDVAQDVEQRRMSAQDVDL